MNKAIIGVIGAAVIAAGAIGGVAVATASSAPSWENELRAAIQEDFETDPDSQDGCSAIGFLGAESPEELADTLLAFGAESIEEEYGELPDGVTPDEAINVVADEVWNLCDL